MSIASKLVETQGVAPPTPRRALGVACGAHALQDGYTDLIYVMLPVWQAEFGLAYAAIGLLRGLFAGAMASFQIPATLLAEKVGMPGVLAGGAALTGLAYMLAGAGGGLTMIVVALLLGGLGASTQHPLASALVSQAFSGPARVRALGTYNFAGDIGKMALPAAAALMLTVMPWRGAVVLLGVLGCLAAIAIIALVPRASQPAAAPEPTYDTAKAVGATRSTMGGFPLLLSIGVLDSATRMGFLTFLPFLLTAKGASLQTVGLALTLVFAGGAAGKLVCAFIGARIGVVATVLLTETFTAGGILALLPLPLEGALALLPIIGVALNGTSSVLYGSLPQVVAPEKRSRAFGVFYTGTIGAGASAPILYGFVGDALGIPGTLAVVACIVLVTLPLALVLRPALAAARED
jgi:FSR family fosmidomycin resistance protein-like MFS transporter